MYSETYTNGSSISLQGVMKNSQKIERCGVKGDPITSTENGLGILIDALHSFKKLVFGSKCGAGAFG